MPVIVLPDLPPPTSPLTAPPLSNILPVWCITVEYRIDKGLRRVPVCGPPGTPARFIQVHAGKADKIIHWAAIGWGTKPPCPSFDTQSNNEVLMDTHFALPCPGKAADGADVVIYMGQYVYALQIAPSDSDTLTGAAAPYQSNPSVTVYQLTPADFNKVFVGPSTLPAGPPPQLIHV